MARSSASVLSQCLDSSIYTIQEVFQLGIEQHMHCGSRAFLTCMFLRTLPAYLYIPPALVLSLDADILASIRMPLIVAMRVAEGCSVTGCKLTAGI